MMIDVMKVWRKLMDSCNVNLMLQKQEQTEIPDFDLGLRRILLSSREEYAFFQLVAKLDEDGVIYYVRDYFDVEYCVVRVPEKERDYGEFIILGPYRDNLMDEVSLEELMENKSVPREYANELKEYYNAVPVVVIHQWRELCRIMCGLLYEEKVQIREKSVRQKTLETEFQTTATDQLSYRMIEERYELEAKIMASISAGDFETAREALKQVAKYKIAGRYKDPIRNLRNGLVIIGALWRKAAEQGGVHPFYIDVLSTQLAKRIELIGSGRDAEQFMVDMLRKYCLLVKNESLRGCSPIIQKVVNHINFNLSEDLSLKMLSAEYSVNPSYLSTLFKKEMEVACSDYISQRRIHKAIKLLNSTNMQIVDVASECGIYDVNYFRKLFKKITGMTPTQYLSEVKKPFHIDS